MDFKNFLLQENNTTMSQKLGNILHAVQDLEENGSSMGSRQQNDNAEKIVNQIRRLLHTHWGAKQKKNLEKLQAIGVAIMKAIEEKGDVKEVLSSSSQELEQVLGDLGTPINTIGSPEDAEQPKDDSDSFNSGKTLQQKNISKDSQ